MTEPVPGHHGGIGSRGRGRLGQAGGRVGGHRRAGEDHVVAPAGPQSQVVPGGLDGDAGRVGPHHEAADPGLGSSVLAQTTIQRRPTAPVEKIFRPVSDQPPGTRRAVVAGRPPRAGVPSSGSTRSALIRTGRALDSATASSYSVGGPRLLPGLRGVLHQGHRADQRDRRVAAAQRVHDGDGLGQSRARDRRGVRRWSRSAARQRARPRSRRRGRPRSGRWLRRPRPAPPSPRAGSPGQAPGRSCRPHRGTGPGGGLMGTRPKPAAS